MNDPIIHALIGAQYGDLEYDVGKSVRWTQAYADNTHITDINLGTQRYWVVNWAITFPQVKHSVVGVNFFVNPEGFRQKQWELAKKAFNPTPEDWVLWVDGHEGLSFDTTSLPDDYLVAPFRSWVWREVARAEALGNDFASLPFFVFCESSELQNVEFVAADGQQNLSARQTVSVPTYVATGQGLQRLFKASALDDPDFDWTRLDQLSAASVDAKAQIISYAYAHWQQLDIEDPAIGVPPLTEDNDEGWEMRKLISQVRPIASFPTATWNPDDQPAGLPGPWCVDTALLPDPDLPDSIIEEFPHTPPAAPTAGVMTPLYDTVFRLNLRDGVWYESGESGNIPLSWDTDAQDWITVYDPETWPELGVNSHLTTTPLTPVNITATYTQYVEPLSDTVRISWDVPDYDFVLEPSVYGYLLEQESQSIISTLGTFPSHDFPTEEATVSVEEGLYRFRVSALNAEGSSEPSVWSPEVGL